MIRILLIAFKKVVFSELEDHVPFHLVGKHAAYQVPLARSQDNWTLRMMMTLAVAMMIFPGKM